MGEPVRALNAKGLEHLADYLESLRSGVVREPPLDILRDGGTSEPVDFQATVEHPQFASRLVGAQYLHEAFSGCSDRAVLAEHAGLWSWLALFFFDQLCPARPDGTRRPGRDYYYIPGTHAWHYYRHKLAGPFRIYELHGECGLPILWNHWGDKEHADDPM